MLAHYLDEILRALMMKRSLYGFLLGSALMVAPAALSAQTVAELKPTGQWLVSSAGMTGLAQAGGTQSPCIMANQYNNGFILRMAGGAQQLLSISLDFRQNAFSQGQTYPAVISIDGGNAHNFTATAFSPGVLIIGVREASGLYQEMMSGSSMALNVVGNTIIFSLDRAREGLQRLESCYSPPSQGKGIQPIPTKPDTEMYVKRGDFPEFKQPNAQDVLKAGGTEKPALAAAESAPVSSHPDMTPAPVAVAAAVPLTSAASGASPVAAVSVVEAVGNLPPLSPQEVADLGLTSEDLKPYEAPAGMKLASAGDGAVVSQTPRAPSVPKVEAQPIEAPAVQPVARVAPTPLTPVSPLEPIVTPTPAAITPPAPATVTPPKPVPVESPRPTAIAAVTPRASESVYRPSGAPVQTVSAMTQQWDAEAGEDMRAVLTRWSERAGADLVWDANDSGKIAQDISVNGTFEDAVAQVMADNAAALGISGQFAEGDKMVPVAAAGRATSAPVTITSGVWTASSGDDLRGVLQGWANRNDVDLNWKAGESFALNAPVNESGDFTAALEAALVQFDNQAVRPVGQLNRDPNTGRMSLTIETDRAS